MRIRINAVKNIVTALSAAAIAVYLPPATAQEGGPGGDKPNPLESLFTPQPQYPTPQTIMNPEAVQPSGQTNPLNNLFTPQPQYPTPQSIMNPQAAEPPGQTNPLYGLFTPQPQYPTPQTIMNPEPVPKHFIPESAPESMPLPLPLPAPPAAPTAKPKAAVKKPAQKKKPAAKKGKKAGKVKATPPPPPPSYNPLKDALFNLNLGHYDSALVIVNKLLESDPNNPEAHYVKAVALVYQQKFADAADEYRKVMSINPNSELAARAAEGLKRINH